MQRGHFYKLLQILLARKYQESILQGQCKDMENSLGFTEEIWKKKTKTTFQTKQLLNTVILKKVT